MAENTEYTKIKESTISSFFTKLKAFFWPKSDVTNVTLADVAVTGDYNDLTNKPTIPAPEIFWATYGTTTASEIDAAVAAGKVVVCNYNDHSYRLEDYRDNQPLYFSCFISSQVRYYLTVNRTTNAWSGDGITYESAGYKVSTLSGNESNTTGYPNAKATYDAIHPAIATTQPAGGFAPNIMYNLGTLSGNTTFALATPADANVVNHYYWTFETGSTAPTITWPSGISWVGGSAPTTNADKHYEVSVLNGIGTFMEV